MLRQGKISYERLWMMMKQKGLSTYEIRRKNIISEATLTMLRKNDYIGGNVTTEAIASLCAALDCQPGDIMEYVPNEELEARGFNIAGVGEN